MPSSGMLGRVALVIMDVSEELSSSIIRVTNIGVLGTNLFITVRFEVFTAANMKNAVVWDVRSCGSCNNGRFGGM
jgi:hypothetical protein